MLDIYRDGNAVRLLKASKTIVFLDLDRTLWSPDEEGAVLHAVVRKEIRELLALHNAVVVFTTARTPELVMSSRAFSASAEMGFARLPPLLKRDRSGKLVYAPIESVREYDSLVDPDLLHSFGCGIYGRVKEAYLPDASFNDKPGSDWRPTNMHFLRELHERTGLVLPHLGPIESAENYHLGLADVLPHPYRIQFDFRDEPDDAKKVALKRLIAEEAPQELRSTFDIVDESRPGDRKFCFYVVPKKKTKAHALQHMVSRLAAAADIPTRELRVFVAGDALTDLSSCYAGPSCDFWFCLPCKAPLSEPLQGGNRKALFAGEPLGPFVRRLAKGDGLPGGHYHLGVPGKRTRRFVIGDLATPGAGAPLSVLSALDMFLEA